ncbi:hypothetical protein B10172_14890 [Campylobacter jejuni]|nr:hypothetical protein B10172_14890 [Campylobacter jejuni]
MILKKYIKEEDYEEYKVFSLKIKVKPEIIKFYCKFNMVLKEEPKIEISKDRENWFTCKDFFYRITC